MVGVCPPNAAMFMNDCMQSGGSLRGRSCGRCCALNAGQKFCCSAKCGSLALPWRKAEGGEEQAVNA